MSIVAEFQAHCILLGGSNGELNVETAYATTAPAREYLTAVLDEGHIGL